MAEVNQYTLTRARALRWLADQNNNNVAFTVYTRPPASRSELEKVLAQVLDRGEMLDALAEKAAKSPTGAVILYQGDKGSVIWPPFPVAESALHRGFAPAPLKSMLEKDW
jgi:hypothetical protein